MTKGKLTVFTGTMYSGKTTALISFLKRAMIGRKKTILFKPLLDNRYSKDEVYTHNGEKLNAFNIECPLEIIKIIKDNPEIEVIGIDEVQFLDTEDIMYVMEVLVNKLNKQVAVAGLDMDYKGRPFGPTPYLMAIADEVRKFKAVCNDCGEDSIYEFRTTESNSLVELGSTESYISLCRTCRQRRLKNKKHEV